MTAPTLSVIMSNYNHARFLPEALGSVLEQSYRPCEIIIIDDASTDESVEVIERFARQDPRIRFVRNERNMGVMHNVRKLLTMASGDYLVGVACDDKVLPGMFEKCMTLLADYPQAGLCSTLTRIMSETGEDQGVLPTTAVTAGPAFLSPAEVRRLLLSIGSWLQGNTIIHRRNALLEAGGFIPELGSFSDAFIAEVSALRFGACFVPEPLAAWRKMENTYSATLTRNMAAMVKIVEHARTLMRSRYADLFPAEYVRRWEDQMLFDIGRATLRRNLLREKAYVSELRSLLPQANLTSRLILGLVTSCIYLQSGLSFLCLTFTRFPHHALGRRLWRLRAEKRTPAARELCYLRMSEAAER